MVTWLAIAVLLSQSAEPVPILIRPQPRPAAQPAPAPQPAEPPPAAPSQLTALPPIAEAPDAGAPAPAEPPRTVEPKPAPAAVEAKPAPASEPSRAALAPEPEKPAPVPSGPVVSLRGAAEAELALLPSGTPQVGLDLYAALRPVAGFGVGDVFSIELGPQFRLLIIDSPPANRADAFNGVLRREDWDELSDYGQFLQSLKIGADTSPVTLRAGVVRKKTLGLGHLVDRYSNQDNPNYHPAGATVVVAVGPVRAEVFASDLLALRLFAGAVSWDVGRTFSPSAEVADRYLLSFEAAYDGGQAGLPRIPLACNDSPCTLLDPRQLVLALLELDGSAVVLRSQMLRLMLLAGFGSRANVVGNVGGNIGLVAGVAADVTVADIALGLKVEVRKQAGGFRHGMIGPGYELARFASTGFSGLPLAADSLPDSLSIFLEARGSIGTMATFDASVESYIWGRIDVDGMLSLTLIDNRLVGTLRFTGLGLGAAGLGVQPRYAATGGLRARLFPSFYALASAGTVFFPQVDGSLARGVTVSAGVGVDFER